MPLEPYYDDGTCVIYHGDCREVLPALETVDLLLTDPPYGVAYVSGWDNPHHGNRPIAGDDGTLDVSACLRLALHQLRLWRHFYIFGPTDASSLTVGATAELIWDKGRPGMGNLALPWGPAHERIAFGVWTKGAAAKGRGGLAARLRKGSVLQVNPDNSGSRAKWHPTEKPVRLLRELIESSSRLGETVLDPFMGAGSTLLAASAEGRRAIGIEVDERYCETAVRRLVAAPATQEALAL